MGCTDNGGGRELIGAWGELANVQMWETVNVRISELVNARISEWALRTMKEEES